MTTQDKVDAMVHELAPLRRLLYPKATPGYLSDLARRIWTMESTGASHFGGADVLAWYLVHRVRAGWSHMQLTQYVTFLWYEKMHGPEVTP